MSEKQAFLDTENAGGAFAAPKVAKAPHADGIIMFDQRLSAFIRVPKSILLDAS
jgi:hypothetical protein